MGRFVALCFLNNEQGKRTMLYVPDHQGLISDVQIKTSIKNLSDTVGWDYVFSIYDTGLRLTEFGNLASYKAYKIFHNGFCTGTCRRQGITDPQWCLKGTTDGKLVCGNDPGDDPMSRFYFKDGFMKCSGNTRITIPIEIYEFTGSVYPFTISNRVNVTDYTINLKTRLFSSSQADDPQISSTNFNTVFGLDRSSAQRCSFSSPSYVPNGSFTNIEYVNVKFNNAPIWSSRQTGDVRILRNNSIGNTGVYFGNSGIFYLLNVSNTQRTPSKIVIFLEDGCACAPFIWNKGGSGSWNWTSLSSGSSGTELDMNRYNFETISGSGSDWFSTTSGKKAFVVTLPTITRRNTQFLFSINNESNSNFYGIQFMFLDEDGQVVDRGSDLLGSNPEKFLCFDQLMRIWGDTYRLQTGSNNGFSRLYIGGDWNGQMGGPNILRSKGPEGTGDDLSTYLPSEYFLYDPRTNKLMTFSNGDIEGEYILYPIDGLMTDGNYIRTYPSNSQPGDAARWIMVPRPSRESNEHDKAVMFQSITNSDIVLGVQGGDSHWGWRTSSNEIQVYTGPHQKNQDGFLLCPNLTLRLNQ